ncbi:MAG TPA: hypothetical protein PLU61_08410 [Rhodoglobus sp.]|nr:hypothetical protein [Rhodoglobus sp.]
MPATIRLGFPFASAFASAWLMACPPFPEQDTCGDGCMSTSLPGTSGPLLPTTSVGDGGFQTVTGAEESTSTSGPGPGGTTGEEWAEPPEIVKVELTPNPILMNGSIDVEVSAQHADGVLMVLEGGVEIQLESGQPGQFEGHFDVITGLDNGEHKALFTPWRDADVHGKEVMALYTIDLPTPGSQILWETSDALGPGEVVALGVLPDGQVVEFGTHFPKGAPRCYLRRRDKKGVSNSVTFILENSDCTAVDMKIDADGALFVLVSRKGGDGVRWWYGKSAGWGKGAINLGTGELGETAVALARHPSGKVAVCGYAPTPSTDVDAMVEIFEPEVPEGTKLRFDYKPEKEGPHTVYERSRDCVFTGDTLALVGEANGKHDLDIIKRDRLFILRVDDDGNSKWNVPKPEVKTQSGAQAVDVDDDGNLVVAGFSCDDICVPEGDLGVYDSNELLKWKVSLGGFKSKDVATKDLVWSPAGYAVVATGGLKDAETLFTVRAFNDMQVPPLWTFTHKDIKQLNFALALVIGPYGEVYAGGMGEDGYPAVAFIGG